MPARPVKVTFAVVGDKELAAAFRNAEKRARALGRANDNAVRRQAAGAERTARASEQAATKAHRAEVAAIKATEREAIASAKRVERIKERSALMAGRVAAQQARAESRAAQAAARVRASAAQAAARDSTRMRHGRAAFAAGAFGRAGGAMMGGARMLGGGLMLGSAAAVGQGVAEGISVERQAALLYNSIRGQRDASGKEIAVPGPQEIAATARAMSVKHAMDPNDIMAGLTVAAERAGGASGYQKMAKDLDHLAKMSRAYGSSMEDMGSVIAAAFNAGIEPGEQLDELLRSFIGQTKEGQIEFRNLAPELAQIAAAGQMMKGDRAKVLTTSLAFTQLAARSQVSPEESTTAFRNFVTEIASKGGTLEKQGIKAYDGTGLRNLPDVIGDIIERAMTTGLKSGPRGEKMKGVGALEAFFGIRSSAIHRMLLDPYEKGGRAGVISEIEKFQTASVSKKDVADAYTTVSETTAFAIEKNLRMFNSEMTKLIPELNKLLPPLTQVTTGLAQLAVWVAQNPLKGIGATFALLLGKELAAAGIAALIRRAFMGGGGVPVPGGGGVGGVGVGVGGKVGQVIGTLGVLGMVADAAYSVGGKIYEHSVGPGMDSDSSDLDKLRSATLGADLALSPNASKKQKQAALNKLLAARGGAADTAFTDATQSAYGTLAYLSGETDKKPGQDRQRVQGLADARIQLLLESIAKGGENFASTVDKAASAFAAKVEGADMANPQSPARGGVPVAGLRS